jgi:hypothetical protein
VIKQLPASAPVPETQVYGTACAVVAPASRPQAMARMPIGNERGRMMKPLILRLKE